MSKSLKWKVLDEMEDTASSGDILGRSVLGMQVGKLGLYRAYVCEGQF